MKIQMLNDVAPIDYDLKGDKTWRETVQWLEGDIYHIDEHEGYLFIVNGDAVEIQDSQSLANEAQEAFNIASRTVRRLGGTREEAAKSGRDAMNAIIESAEPDSIMGLMANIKKLSEEILK